MASICEACANLLTGIFMSFAESLNQCLRTSLPVLFTALTFLGMSLARSSRDVPQQQSSHWFSNNFVGNATETPIDYTKNDLLLGSQDTFFWFLVPLFGSVCIGICVVLNYITLGLTHIFTIMYSMVRSASLRSDDGRYITPALLKIPP